MTLPTYKQAFKHLNTEDMYRNFLTAFLQVKQSQPQSTHDMDIAINMLKKIRHP